jgi:hypothetical protein
MFMCARRQLVWAAVFGLIVGVHAQSDRRGSISGAVSSSSGSPMPNVTVVIQNVDNNVKQQTVTDTSGNYRFDSIEAGRYRVTASANGTSGTPADIITVTPGSGTVVSITAGGSTRQNAATSPVTAVEEASPIQELNGPRIETSWNTRDIQYLPSTNYLARDGAEYGAYNLSLLSAGVASNGGIGPGRAPVVGGQRPTSNGFYLEGIDNNNRADPGQLTVVSNEGNTEFVSYQNQFPPAYGHSSGGQFNITAREGNNEVHGGLFEYFQNRNLDAVDQSFARQGVTDNPRYDQNRFGGNVGFPIIRDKVFFFGDFEYIPLGVASAPASPVFAPTAAGYATLSGLPGVSRTNLGVLQTYLPEAQTALSFAAVNGTQIPLGFAPILSRTHQNQYNGVGSIDWKIGQTDSLQARYTINDLLGNTSTAVLPMFIEPQRTRSMVVSLSEYHNFSAVAINELRLGYSRVDVNTGSNGLTLPGLGAFPNIGIEQDLNLQLGSGLTGPTFAAINTYSLADNFHWVIGRHTFLAGFDGRRYLGPMTYGGLGAGNFEYSNLQTFLNNLPPDVAGERAIGSLTYNDDQYNLYGYLKDEWRVTPNFHLDLGVRYEWASVPGSLKNQRLNSIADVPGVLTFGKPHTQNTDFAPAIGLAFSPGLIKDSVFRAGFGMNYEANSYGELPIFTPGFTTLLYTNNLVASPGFFGGTYFDNPTTNIFSPSITPQQARALTTSFIPTQKLPYTMQWNASWQQSMFRRFVLEVRYLGVHAVHLPTETVLNETPRVTATQNLPLYFTAPSQAQLNSLTTTLPGLEAIPNNLLAPAGFTSPITMVTPQGSSMYHGLAVQGTQRFSGGFQFLAAYTWSHLIDNVGDPYFSGLPTYDTFEHNISRNSSVYDHRQRGTLTALWDLGAVGKQGFNWVRDILVNMNLAGTYTYETPASATLQSGFDTLLGGGFYPSGVFTNPNGTSETGSGVTSLTNSQGQVVAYLANNPNAAFVRGGLGTFPNSGRNNFGLRPINNFDVSLVKRFAIKSKFNLEFRADAYNVLNHPQFTPGQVNNIGSPQLTSLNYLIPGTSAFGTSESVFSSHPRSLQLGVRILF